jgi:hypothetical protein
MAKAGLNLFAQAVIFPADPLDVSGALGRLAIARRLIHSFDCLQPFRSHASTCARYMLAVRSGRLWRVLIGHWNTHNLSGPGGIPKPEVGDVQSGSAR